MTAARLHVEHVTQNVLFSESVRTLCYDGGQKIILPTGPMSLQIIECIFVGLKTDDFDDTRTPFNLLFCGRTFGPTALPFWGESHLLDTRKQHCVEVIAALSEDELSSTSILTI